MMMHLLANFFKNYDYYRMQVPERQLSAKHHFWQKQKNGFWPFPEMVDGEKGIILDHNQQASMRFETGIPTGKRNLMTKHHSFSEPCPSPSV